MSWLRETSSASYLTNRPPVFHSYYYPAPVVFASGYFCFSATSDASNMHLVDSAINGQLIDNPSSVESEFKYLTYINLSIPLYFKSPKVNIKYILEKKKYTKKTYSNNFEIPRSLSSSLIQNYRNYSRQTKFRSTVTNHQADQQVA